MKVVQEELVFNFPHSASPFSQDLKNCWDYGKMRGTMNHGPSSKYVDFSGGRLRLQHCRRSSLTKTSTYLLSWQ